MKPIEFDLIDPRPALTIVRCHPMRYVLKGIVLTEFFYLPPDTEDDDSD